MESVKSNSPVYLYCACRALLFFFLALVLPASILCQVPSSNPPSHALSGTVLDPSSADVAEAQVTLLAANGAIQASTTTDRAGFFFFDDLPHGKYRLRIHAGGFRDGFLDVT